MKRHSTVMAAFPKRALCFAERAGLDKRRLLTISDLESAEMDDPECYVPLGALVALTRACDNATRQREALLVSAARDSELLAQYGVVGHIFANSPNVLEAFRAFGRYAHLLGDGFEVHVRRTGAVFSIDYGAPCPLGDIPLFNEGTAAAHVGLIRRLSGRRISPLRVTVTHARNRYSRYIEEIVDAPIIYSQETTALHYPREVGDIPLRGADPWLLRFLERYATVAAPRPSTYGKWAARTRDILLAAAREGFPSPPQVARKLAVSPRTLQRRLAEEGTHFAELLDETRRDLALDYVADPLWDLSEVAHKLGYADLSTFDRAFRRWTDQCPSHYRGVLRESG